MNHEIFSFKEAFRTFVSIGNYNLSENVDTEFGFDEVNGDTTKMQFDLGIAKEFQNEEPEMVSRDEVYHTIEAYDRFNQVERVKRNVENRFPEHEFGDELPYWQTLELLICDNFYKKQ